MTMAPHDRVRATVARTLPGPTGLPALPFAGGGFSFTEPTATRLEFEACRESRGREGKMLTPFHPAHQAERCFIADDEGIERFHPLGALGPAYRIEDPAQRERLIRITTGFHWGLALGLLLGMVVIGAEWRGKGGDRFAVALAASPPSAPGLSHGAAGGAAGLPHGGERLARPARQSPGNPAPWSRPRGDPCAGPGARTPAGRAVLGFPPFSLSSRDPLARVGASR